MTLGTDYILNALADEGLRHLFMVPGGLVDPFLPALARQAQAQADGRRARGRRGLHGGRLCPRERNLRRGARHRRPGLVATWRPPSPPPRPTARRSWC